MDMDDFCEWTARAVSAVAFVMAGLVVIMLLLGAVNEVGRQIRRLRRRRQRQRQQRLATTASFVVVEKLLESIPDVEYQELLPPAGAVGGGDRESCAICVTPFEAGEACSALPACRHLFHKACIAKWLRVSCTCPLCRAAVALPLPQTSSLQDSLNAAENMV